MQRVFYPYWLWEEYKLGMWRNVYGEERELLLKKAIEFTGNANLYGKYMLKVMIEMPLSTEMNLTNPSMNHQAWIGHAACCIAINCPEDIVRIAWWNLTQKQRDKANLKADKAIETWNKKYIRGYQLCLKLG